MPDVLPHPDGPDSTARPWCSVVIPVLHEAVTIAAQVAHVRHVAARCGMEAEVEVVVADGAKERDTLAALPEGCCTAVASCPGRARQMNAGAGKARGETLLFLHADTHLPPEAFTLLRRARQAGIRAGAFRLGLAAPGLWFRLVERLACWRNRLVRTPYGDQAQFFDAALFMAVGGYPDQPLMEDVEVMRRLRKAGERIVILPGRVETSARRWFVEGPLRCTLRNLCLRLLYALGVPAHALSRWYRAHKERP